MHNPHNFLGSLSARRVDDATVQVTRVRMDASSHRMLFEEVCLIAADPADALEVQQCLYLALSILLERDGVPLVTPKRPPQDG